MKKLSLAALALLFFIAAIFLGVMPADDGLARLSLVLLLLLWTVGVLFAVTEGETLNAAGLLLVLASYDVCKAIRPPLPASLVALYVGFAVIGLAVYVSIEGRHMSAFTDLWAKFLVEERARLPRLAAAVLLPGWVGVTAYAVAMPTLEPPVALRVIHPAPPSSVKVRGKTFNLATAANPFRKDAANLQASLDEGKTIYYRNCFFCHGDTLDGKGHFAPAFNPFPANFVDVGTIAMLQESYVFWRVAKGGPGLPKESAPWSSAMPRWEDMLSEDEIWKVVLYIYEGTGHSPRTWEEATVHE